MPFFRRKVTQFVVVALLGLTSLGLVVASGKTDDPGSNPAPSGKQSAEPKNPSGQVVPAPPPPATQQPDTLVPPVPRFGPQGEQIDNDFSWEQHEAGMREIIASYKRMKIGDPRGGMVNLICVHVPSDFCRQAGLVPDGPDKGGDATEIAGFALSKRETRMFLALLHACPQKKKVLRMGFNWNDGKPLRFTNYAEVAATELEQSSRDGNPVYVSKGEKQFLNADLRITTRIEPDDKCARLSIEFIALGQSGKPVTIPVIDSSKDSAKGVSRPKSLVLIDVEGKTFSVESFATTMAVPLDGTVVIKGIREKLSDDGLAKNGETLWILTPGVVNGKP
jgi:hypothetical protein